MSLLNTLGLPAPRHPTPAAAGQGPAQAAAAALRAAGKSTAAPTARPASAPASPTSAAPAPRPVGPGAVNPALQAAGPAAGPAPDKNAAAYATARAAVQKLVDALKAHPQNARIAAQIAAATAKLGEADTLAGAAEWSKAGKALVEGKTMCAAAKKLADEWAVYMRKRGEAHAIALSLGSADWDAGAYVNPKLATADGFANGSPPNWASALKELKAIVDEIKPLIKQNITLVKGKLAAIGKSSKEVQAFAKAQIDEGTGHLSAAEAAFGAGEWSLCFQNVSAALRILGPTARVCERRGKYQSQRATTVAAIAKVRAAPLLKARADALDAEVAKADKLAAADALKFEQGIAVLQAAATQAGVWAGLAKTVAAHAKDRAAADAELAALDAHAAAAKIQKERDAIRAVLAGASTLATAAAAAAEPVAAWNAAVTEVARARTDLAAAKKLAESMATASAAEAAAANPADTKALKGALDKLLADGKAASKAPHAGQAKTELATFDARAKAAVDALAKSDGAGAAAAMKDAAAALTAAKAVQAGHAQVAASLPAVEAQLKLLKKSKRAAQIKARLDPIDAALAEAAAKSAAHDAAGAMAAARRANDLLAPAKQADKDREQHDQRAEALAKRVAKVKDAAEKTALETMAADAGKHADALAFADATKALDAIEVRLDKSQLEGLMKGAKPDQKAIAALAKKMVGKGGDKTVDKLIQDIPNGGDIRLLNALAEGRYGVKFKNDAPFPADPSTGDPAGDPVATMKIVCDMFSQIPQDIVKSPSVQGVEWSDAVGSAGGSFSYDDAKVRMSGRPGINQDFGAAQTNWDPKTLTSVPQLPPGVDPDCQPKDATPIEYLGFAAAHEVGHAVDDAQGFMARKGHLPEFGEWTNYGASVQPIADAVGADARYAAFYKTPEQKQYVLDKILNKPATAPAPADAAEAAALAAFDQWHSIATSADVYRRQGDCDAIKIGDFVYHEAYARQWVRYRADARKKALTGYQFRAPGEWFAELYAGYRSGKLKDTHPAMSWLKTLSTA